MSRPPESSFFDGHVDALSYIHFIYERIQCITKISFNRKILENDLQNKLIQNFLVPIPFDEFLFSQHAFHPVILLGAEGEVAESAPATSPPKISSAGVASSD
jgi:hypothetical protein